VYLFVPESPIKTPSRLDIPGAFLLSTGLVCLLLALTEGEHWGWGSGGILGLFAAAAVVLTIWGFVELRVPEPMVDMRMLANRPVLFTNLTALIAGFALFGSFILVPTLLQLPREIAYGFGASATVTGLYLLPSSITGFVSGPFAGVMSRYISAKWPLSLGMALGGVGLAWLAIWHSSAWHIVAGMLILGAGLPMTFAAMAKIIVDAVRPTETGVATGMNTVMRTIGGVVGGQVGAALLTAETLASGVPAESAFVTAFAVGAGSSFVAAGIAVLITPRVRRPQPAVA
jgi:MFS family permease